jgi:hypothetical protein
VTEVVESWGLARREESVVYAAFEVSSSRSPKMVCRARALPQYSSCTTSQMDEHIFRMEYIVLHPFIGFV